MSPTGIIVAVGFVYFVMDGRLTVARLLVKMVTVAIIMAAVAIILAAVAVIMAAVSWPLVDLVEVMRVFTGRTVRTVA